MKKKFLIISVLVLVAFGFLVYMDSGQTLIKLYLRSAGNYSTPKLESPASILSKVQHENLSYDRLYRLEDYKAFSDFQEKNITSFPFVQIYNREKKMMTIASGSECRWALMDFFTKRDTSKLISQNSLMYEFVTNRLDPIDIKTSKDTFDYYVIAGWVNYLPAFSENLFRQTNEMKKSMKEKVCFTYINLDMQEDWEEEMEAQELK